MTRFLDLHVRPNLERLGAVESLIAKSAELGYTLIAVSLPPRIKLDDLRFLKKTTHDHDLGFATRIDLHPRSATELLRNLRILRRRFEIVAVDCSTKTVARQAAKDRRVDLLVFPSTRSIDRHFDVAEGRLASQGCVALEIGMQSILHTRGFVRVRYLSCLRKELAISQKFQIPVVLSSGAAEMHQLRGPHDVASMATLFGMAKNSALKAVSHNPWTIVERNREKLNPNHIAQGIRVVRRTSKCDM
jgi:ribonuclease P/MRP protein subunit RPP1